MVCAFNNDGIGSRNIDTRFDDRGTHQHVKTLVVEVVHHSFQLTLTHLAMADSNTRFRYKLGEAIGCFLNVFYIVIEIVDLTTTQHFTQDCFANHQAVVLANESFNCQSACRRRCDNRQIAHSAHCHIQRARNRCGS